MKSKSLRLAIEMIIDNLDKMNINTQDKVELMLNLRAFLAPEDYKENVAILQEHQQKKKVR